MTVIQKQTDLCRSQLLDHKFKSLYHKIFQHLCSLNLMLISSYEKKFTHVFAFKQMFNSENLGAEMV